MNGPLYDVVLLLHIASAVTGFGAVGASGWNAGAAVTNGGATTDRIERARRFFGPGRNWPARALLLVPVFGAILLAIGHPSDASRAYPWIGLAIWLVAAGVVSAVVWPAEREIQTAVAEGSRFPPRSALRLRRAAGVASVLFVAALAVMVVQPG